MADEKIQLPDYYKTIVVRHISDERGAEEFDKKCNEYESMHTVKHRTSGFAYANQSFVFVMTFCCDGNDRY